MSARFVGASSQHLGKSTPSVTTYPFSIGLWTYPQQDATLQRLWTVVRSGATANSFALQFAAAGNFAISANDGAGATTGTAGTYTADSGWYYVVGRFIDATNRRISVLQPDGLPAHGQSTTSRNPAAPTAEALGVFAVSLTGYLTGRIGEYWITNTDIQADGAQLQDSTLRQLAYGGPFSLPHIAKDIIEYRSFEDCLDSRQDRPGSVYYRGTRPVWTNTNGVTLGPHPPAAIWYDKPLPELGPVVIV